MTKYDQGLPPSYPDPEDYILRDLTLGQQRMARNYAEEFAALPLVADIMRSNDPLDVERVQLWHDIFLIRHQYSLFLYDYTKEERNIMHDLLKQWRAAGKYTEEFRRFDHNQVREDNT